MLIIKKVNIQKRRGDEKLKKLQLIPLLRQREKLTPGKT